MNTSIHDIGSIIRAERKARGWSQDDVAGRVGVRGLAVGKWERGQANPSTDNRLALAELFGLDPRELGIELRAPMAGGTDELREWFRAEFAAIREDQRRMHAESMQLLGDVLNAVRAGG